jgi:hypothetical protein
MEEQLVVDLKNDEPAEPEREDKGVICPLCGAMAVEEKCKIICRSDVCRGRVVMNCSEF